MSTGAPIPGGKRGLLLLISAAIIASSIILIALPSFVIFPRVARSNAALQVNLLFFMGVGTLCAGLILRAVLLKLKVHGDSLEARIKDYLDRLLLVQIISYCLCESAVVLGFVLRTSFAEETLGITLSALGIGLMLYYFPLPSRALREMPQ